MIKPAPRQPMRQSGRLGIIGPIARAKSGSGADMAGSRSGGREHAPLAGQREADVFLAHRARFDLSVEPRLKVLNTVLNVLLRRAGPGRDEYRVARLKPVLAQLVGAVDQVSWFARSSGDLGEALAVRAVLASKNEYNVGLGDELLHRVLTVLGRVADVVLVRPDDLRVLPHERVDHYLRLVHAERRLCQEGEFRIDRQAECVDIVRVLHQHDAGRGFAHRPDYLVVPLVADEDDRVALARELQRLHVNFRYQRTGGV